MTDMGQPFIVHYPDAGAPQVYTPESDDMDDSIPGLAMAVDAAIDAIGDALDEGNIGQAQALLTAAETVSDALLAAVGAPDADDPDDGGMG
jgi:hypothetical protein